MSQKQPNKHGLLPSASVTVHHSKYRHFFCHYNELHDAYVLLLLNKNAGSQFGLVQRSDGARQILNAVWELSDQASRFPHYKVALPLSAGAIHYHELKLILG
jgi:hypothetical protein